MNESLVFWRDWNKSEKYSLLTLFVIAIALIIYSLFSWYLDLNNVLKWDVLSELHDKIISSKLFTENDINFSASSPILYVKEKFLPSLIHINIWAYYTLLVAGIIGLSLILTGTSRLNGQGFLIGALALGLVLVSFRFENVFLLNKNWVFLMVFVVLGAVYYLSNIYKQKFTHFNVLSLWLIAFLFLALIVYKFTEINLPFMSLAAYGFVGFFIITLIFIFLISHEILSGLFLLVTNNSQKGQSFIGPFLLISAVYFANVILVYLENSKMITESAFILHPIIIFIISAVIGFWGYKHAVDQQQKLSFRQSGIWLYLGMAIIAIATFAMVYATVNDAMQEFLEDYVAICQLAVGGCFFFYVLFNFLSLIKQGLNFQKVLYKPPFARLILARIAAVFLVVLIFGSKNYYSYYQIRAGLENSIADFYLHEGDLKSAETFYKSSATFDIYNHKANYSLASIALNNGDRVNAAYFFKQSLQKKPSAYAYAGLSASLETENMYFDALFALKEGAKKFPNNSQLLNNLAFLQDKSNFKDSTLINLNLALKHCQNCDVEQSNYLAFWIENAKMERLQEMTNLTKPTPYLSYQANLSAIDKILNKKYEIQSLPIAKDSIINVSTDALISNVCSNPLADLPKNFNATTLRILQQKNENSEYFEDLSWAFATQNYYRETKTEGLKQLTIMANSDIKNANLYNQNLGLWLLKEGAYNQGIDRLKLANDQASATILQGEKYKTNYESNLAQNAAEIIKGGINLENYKNLVNKAPLNPYLLEKVANFLNQKKQHLAAYNLVFYATELNPDSPKLWQIYIQQALALSQYEFAEDGLSKLKPLVSAAEYGIFKSEIDNQKTGVDNFK